MTELHAHKLVAETAENMAHELYDVMMQDNEWYSVWKKCHPGLSVKGLETAFVRRNLTQLIPKARAILAAMLTGPYDDDMKDKIHEALLLDWTLIKGRGHGREH